MQQKRLKIISNKKLLP